MVDKTLTLNVPENVVKRLEAAAPKLGMTLEQAAVHALQHYALPGETGPGEQGLGEPDGVNEAAWAALMRHAGALEQRSVRVGDNDALDADLAKEYGRGL